MTRKHYIESSARPVFLKPDERAAMEDAERQFRESDEGRAVCVVVQLPAPVAPKCDTLGHEYNFGICLDCEQVDPAFEPDDDMIEADYLRQQFAA